jgi:drug/metabolite transporter (DMT)-like permease
VQDTLLTVVLALGAAALFGVNVLVQTRAKRGADGLLGALLSVSVMSAMFLLVAPFTVSPAWFLTGAAGLFAMVGLMFPAAGQGLQIAAVSRVGPALTSSIGAFAPVFAVVPAVLLLDEPLGLQGAAALVLMVAGLALAPLGPRGLARGWPLWALLLPLGAGAARGLGQPALKAGLAEVPSPIFATLVASLVSTAVLGLVMLLRRRPAAPRPPSSRGALALFGLSGLINGFGILSLNGALSQGQVTLAAPLASTTPLWVLLFSLLFLRGETVPRRQLLIALLVVAGGALLVTRPA